MKNNILILVIMLLTVAQALPFTYLGSIEGVGDPVLSVTGRSLGMGNASIASSEGVDSIFYNPANMLRHRRPAVSMGFGLLPVKETIETEDEPTNYSSANYFKFTGIAGMYPVKKALRIGIGYRPVIDMDYDHSRNIYDSGVIGAQKKYDSSGGIGATIISFACEIVRPVKIGINCDILSGRLESEKTEIAVEATKNIENMDNKYNGVRYGIGLDWEIVEKKFNIGLKWASSSVVENTWEVEKETYVWTGSIWPDSAGSDSVSEGKLEYKYPAEIGLGLSYGFHERENSILSIDIVRTYWKDFRYKETKNTSGPDYKKKKNPHYRNTTRISIGVEHQLTFKTVLRYGFTHMPHYSRTSCDTTMFTAGLGFPVGESIGIDIAGSYGKRNFYGQNVFYDEDEMVDERIAKLFFTIDRKF